MSINSRTITFPRILFKYKWKHINSAPLARYTEVELKPRVYDVRPRGQMSGFGETGMAWSGYADNETGWKKKTYTHRYAFASSKDYTSIKLVRLRGHQHHFGNRVFLPSFRLRVFFIVFYTVIWTLGPLIGLTKIWEGFCTTFCWE